MTPLEAAVEQHVAERGRLFNPAEARDRCQTESAAFMETLAAHGVEATVVSGLLLDGGVVVCGHFAVRVGDDVWDWTLRQFDPAADVPTVTPWETWQRDWWNPTEGWLAPMVEPVSILFGMAEQLAEEDA